MQASQPTAGTIIRLANEIMWHTHAQIIYDWKYVPNYFYYNHPCHLDRQICIVNKYLYIYISIYIYIPYIYIQTCWQYRHINMFIVIQKHSKLHGNTTCTWLSTVETFWITGHRLLLFRAESGKHIHQLRLLRSGGRHGDKWKQHLVTLAWDVMQD